MDVKAAIRGLLLADTTVSGLAGTRIEPLELFQDEADPTILYACSERQGVQCADGSFLNLYSCTFRFDCYGGVSGAASAEALADAVRSCLFSRANMLSLVGSGTVRLRGVQDGGSEDGLDPPVHAEGAGIDYVSVTVTVHWGTV